jgi:drug/metabolite transporter (DMT)-like permease
LPAADDGSVRKGFVFGVLMAVVWGIQAVVSRQSVADGLSAVDVTVVRFLVAGLVLLPLAFRYKPFPVGRLGWWRAAVLTVLAGVPYSLVLVGGAAFAPANHSAVIGPGLIPPVSALLAYVFLGERTGKTQLIGIAIILAGICIFSWDALTGAGVHPGAWRGDLLFVLTAPMWAAFGLLAKRWGVSAIEATVAICMLSMLSMPLWVPFMPMNLLEAKLSAIALQAIYQGLFVGVLSLFLYARCVTLLGAMRTTLFVPLVPVVAAIGGALVLAEIPSAFELIGMFAVIAGMFVALGAKDTAQP